PKPFDRFGHTGDSYSMGQWYPKVAVYDDRGWHADPYHYFSEFYGDFGTFDVAITLPDRFWVGATGTLRGATGGDNEIPLADRETARDSVTVRLRAVTADSLRERWPRSRLSVESDLTDLEGKSRAPLELKRDQEVALRVPRGAPLHYSYSWVESDRESRSEADTAGRPRPLRLVAAARDTTVRDTIRALAAASTPLDSVMPSLKTLHFHAERVHDFARLRSRRHGLEPDRDPGAVVPLRSGPLERSARLRRLGHEVNHARGGPVRLAFVHQRGGLRRGRGDGIPDA